MILFPFKINQRPSKFFILIPTVQYRVCSLTPRCYAHRKVCQQCAWCTTRSLTPPVGYTLRSFLRVWISWRNWNRIGPNSDLYFHKQKVKQLEKHSKVNFWNWGTLTIWHKMTSFESFLNHSILLQGYTSRYCQRPKFRHTFCRKIFFSQNLFWFPLLEVFECVSTISSYAMQKNIFWFLHGIAAKINFPQKCRNMEQCS